MRSHVETTAGEIESGELGLTLVHEHLRVRSESIAFQFPHLYDEANEYERAVSAVRSAMERGVKTIRVLVIQQNIKQRLTGSLA